jgi:hypothetical protein
MSPTKHDTSPGKTAEGIKIEDAGMSSPPQVKKVDERRKGPTEHKNSEFDFMLK